MRAKSPCMNCEDRHSGCHSTCERYIGYSNALREEKQNIINQKAQAQMLSDVKHAGQKRMKTNRNKTFRSDKLS